jgi:hypothetical protein
LAEGLFSGVAQLQATKERALKEKNYGCPLAPFDVPVIVHRIGGELTGLTALGDRMT